MKFIFTFPEMLVTPVTPASALTINDLTFFHGWVMTRIPVATILDLQISKRGEGLGSGDKSKHYRQSC